MEMEDVTEEVSATFVMVLNHDVQRFTADRGVRSRTKYLQNNIKILNVIYGTEIWHFNEE